jgi:hypothetical protein
MWAEAMEFIEIPDLQGKLYEATGRLTEAVSHFYHLYMPTSEPAVVKHLAPNLEMLLVFNFGPPVKFSFGNEKPGSKTIEKTAVIGPLRKMLNYELKPGDDLIVVNFKLNGFYRLFKVSLSNIHDGDSYDPDVLLGKSCFSDIWLQLAQMTSINDRLDLLSRYGLEYLIKNDPEGIIYKSCGVVYKKLSIDIGEPE